MIVDCFLFYNEYDVAEIRMNELDSVVDYFVILKSDKTFRGNINEYDFPRQEKFKHKTVFYEHKMPSNFTSAWDREHHFRRSAREAVSLVPGLSPDDRIVFSDCDEIPRASSLAEIRDQQTVNFQLDQYYYNFNYFKGHNCGAFSCMERDFIDPQSMRLSDYEIIPNSGWEFSYFGDEEFIKNKIQNFSHSELDLPDFTDINKISNRIRNNRDAFDRDETRIYTENPLPDFVVKNSERFKDFL